MPDKFHRRSEVQLFDFGKHAVFIWGSYGTAVVVLAALMWWLIVDGRRHTAALQELESNRSDAARPGDE